MFRPMPESGIGMCIPESILFITAITAAWNMILISPREPTPTQIQFAVKGADALNIDSVGNLVLTKGSSELRFQAPILYQEIKGSPCAGARHLCFAR